MSYQIINNYIIYCDGCKKQEERRGVTIEYPKGWTKEKMHPNAFKSGDIPKWIGMLPSDYDLCPECTKKLAARIARADSRRFGPLIKKLRKNK